MSQQPSPSPRKPWFAPKRFGYGAGLPISWEGWAALALFVALLIGGQWAISVWFAGASHAMLRVLWAIVIVVPFTLIVRAHTAGGWRWRGGDRA